MSIRNQSNQGQSLATRRCSWKRNVLKVKKFQIPYCHTGNIKKTCKQKNEGGCHDALTIYGPPKLSTVYVEKLLFLTTQ